MILGLCSSTHTLNKSQHKIKHTSLLTFKWTILNQICVKSGNEL
uniref:Uncharacterized protein n=1 Tax=Anguilla anguilla TaxID=7936 RepID=A0A0E9PPZ3_ANGAN